MSPEEGSNQTNELSGDGAAGPVCGERLAEARRSLGIPVHEIAKELHLDEAKVRALEENNFAVLGAPVFVKGHMRKYAGLVGVPIDDVLSDYYRLNRSAGAPPVVGPPRKVAREISIGPWVGGVLLIVLVSGASWWWFGLKSEPIAAQPEMPAPLESELQEASEVDNDASAVDAELGVLPTEETQASASAEDTEDSPPAATVVAEPEPVVAEQIVDVEPDLAGNSVELVLSFAGDCWTEVTDATGQRLFFDLGTEGRTVTIRGVEPLGVLLGNSSNVSIRVNGFDYSIPAANRRGNTARLTIYGQ